MKNNSLKKTEKASLEFFSPKFAIIAGFTSADLLICQKKKKKASAGEKNGTFYKEKRGMEDKSPKLRYCLKNILLNFW